MACAGNIHNTAGTGMIRATIIAMACLSLLGCAKQPHSFSTSQATSATGTVQSVSQSDRHLVVLTTDGRRLLVEAPADVANFDRIHEGDQILLTYHQGLVAEVRPAGAEAQDPTRTSSSVRTPPGESPTKAVGHTTFATVQIQAVDPASNTVTFTRPDGVTRTLAVETPKGQQFIRRLRPGDQVDVTYHEAAAVSIQPARR